MSDDSRLWDILDVQLRLCGIVDDILRVGSCHIVPRRFERNSYQIQMWVQEIRGCIVQLYWVLSFRVWS